MVLNETRKKICDVINTCNLPLDAIYYILKDITNEVWDEVLRQEELERQRKAQAKELEEEKAAAAKELEDEVNDVELAAANKD